MRCLYLGVFSATTLLLSASGCLHLAPNPVDLRGTKARLQATDLNAEPVQVYAASLATATGVPDTPFNATDGLSLREGQAVALWYNLDLCVARLRAQQAEAVAQFSGRWADPQLGIETGEKSVDTDPQGFLKGAGGVTRSWIHAETLSITIPLSGRLRMEKRLGRAEYEAVLLRAAEAEWEMLAKVRDAWAHWSAARERVKLLGEHLQLLGTVSETADALARVGELTPSSARLFAIERMRNEAVRERAMATETEERAKLLQLLGLLPDASVELLPEMNVVVPPHPAPPALELHPAITRSLAELRAAEDRLRLELRKQYPDLTLSPTYTDEQDQTSFVLGLGIPVPVWNANRQGIAEAEAARNVARATVEAEYQRLNAELAQAQAALHGTQAQRLRLTERVAPVIDEQMAEVLALLNVGEIDIIFLYETVAQALEAKQELLNTTLAESLAASRFTSVVAFDQTIIATQQESGK